jgi:uncharacterized protein YjbI with pentapeptide repeats
MANPDHLRILEQGTDIWNRWRTENDGIVPELENANLGWLNLAGADLKGARLTGAVFYRSVLPGVDLTGSNLCWAEFHRADLNGADLSHAALVRTDFSGTGLNGANLSHADLMGASLQGADLGGANFTGANLTFTHFSLSALENSNFTNAVAAFTVFGDNDLSTVKGLETVHHLGPSTIGLDTIYNSKGNIPEVFLRGCGVPEDFIVYIRSLVGKAIDYFSCFISYSTKDDDFAQRLYADLKAKNVRCWKFDESAKWGAPVWGEIDTAIRHSDKLVVICSEHSLQSPPVIREIERALQKEDREHKNVLFPVRIDDYLFDAWEHARKADVVSKVAGDFRAWRDLAAYSKAFPRFLDALNRPQQPAATS